MSSYEELFGEVIHAYTAKQGLADGMLVQCHPEVARETGFRLPVLMTKAAFAEVVEWSRPGEEWLQSEDARFRDVLTLARYSMRSRPNETAATLTVARVPNRTKSGAFSKAQTPTDVRLKVTLEGFDVAGDPCLIISLPEED